MLIFGLDQKYFLPIRFAYKRTFFLIRKLEMTSSSKVRIACYEYASFGNCIALKKNKWYKGAQSR